jgi:hypothetical protein
MAKAGDYVFLPEPFYFNQSIVRYNNRLYQCIISNNDTEFVIGKWELIDSGDRRLNELDRIIGYYNPTVNMPGRDLTQLVTGITYPGSVYMDNAFPPAEEFLLDTELQDQPFYPATINNVSVLWNGSRYITLSTSPTYSALLTSTTGDNWALTKLSNNPVSLTDIYYGNNKYVITTTNSATPIYTSVDGLVYTTGPSLTVPSNSLVDVFYGNGTWVAVGENIISSLDTVSWVETFNQAYSNAYFTGVVYTGTGSGWLVVGNRTINGVTQAVILQSTGNGFQWNIVNDGVTTNITSSFLNAITYGEGVAVIVGNTGRIFTTTTGAITTSRRTSGTTNNLVDVTYGAGIFIAVGNNGTILTSTTGSTWVVRTSGTTNNLNSVTYNNTAGEFIAVGDNNTILTSPTGTTWTASALFLQEEPVYTVQGDTFTEGYGPEELVPGVVTDNLTMIVTTRPGTNWEVGQYGHTGFTVISTELTTTEYGYYSFLNIVQNPAFIAVYDINPSTGLSRRIYESYQYSVDWVLKTITLNNYSLDSGHILGVDLYEVGNGDQLQRSNSQTVPLIDNPDTGFIEMPLSCNYSANNFNGNGLIRPSTESEQIECTRTEETIDTITCADVSILTLNEPVQFQGDVFGGIQLDQTYYIKTISYVTNKITVSLPPLISGIAGPTFPLTNDTGSMQLINQVGTGVVWTDPIVIHNGTKLILGETSIVTQTKSATNSIVVNSALTVDINDPIVFSDYIFGGLLPHTTYYVKSILDPNDITVSATLGGSIQPLTDATGFASFVTNDFAISQANEGPTAKLMFANNYTQENDFVTFAVLGETSPVQYGYSIPVTQIYESVGGETQLLLTNYIGGTNIENAVVELNGLRLTNQSQYTIDLIAQTLYLTNSLTAGDILAVTTYNSTERQYLNTTLGGTYSGSSSITLNIGSSSHFPGFDETVYGGGTQTTSGSFIVGQGYIITTINDGIGGANTNFTLIGAANNDIGTYFVATGVGAGTGSALQSTGAVFSPGPDYFTLSSGNTSQLLVNTPIIFSSPIGGVVAGTVYYIANILSISTFTVSLNPDGDPITLVTATGSMIGFINPPRVSNIVAIDNQISTPVVTTIVSSATAPNTLTATSTTGFIAAGSGIYQSIIFKNTTGDPGPGGILTDGTVYWVNTVINGTDFTISDTPGGAPVTVTGAAGTMIAYVGGNPTTTITTGVPHNLQQNDVVRIDGVNGSTQLNNNTYYAHIISDTQIGLYLSPYLPESYQTNEPVLGVTNWEGGGYVWFDKQFTLISATATESSSVDNSITVESLENLVIDTPVYFSGTVFGGVVEGNKYFIKSIDAGQNKITLSTTYQGSTVSITTYTGSDTMGVAMWEQTNVDRIWVTVNGYRVPSSSLIINPNNNLGILTTIVPGDIVTITNMIPTSTPDELTYINNVNQSNIPSVYRATVLSTTWLTRPLSYTDDTIYVEDVTKITTEVVQNETVPAAVGGVYTIGLDADKRIISQVIVVNNSTSTPTTLPSSAYSVQIINTAPVVEITSGVTVGESLTITVILGNLIYVDGEQIKFTTVNFNENSLSGLQRGTNGTGERYYIPQYTKVYGILSTNRLPQVNYNLTWNSYVYNPVLGDPLQISNTPAATFLNAQF